MTNFITKNKFSRAVDNMVLEKKMSYMDAVVYACDIYNIDALDVKKFLSKMIKEKIESEAQELHYLPRGNKLPI